VREVDVIVRREDESWNAWSPQVPGVYAVGDELDQVKESFAEAVADHLGESAELRLHLERDGGNKVVIRIADDHGAERMRVANAFLATLWDPPTVERLARTARNEAGEHLIICVVPSDSVHWVSQQLEDGDSATVLLQLKSGGVFLLDVIRDADAIGPTLEELGLTAQTIMGELADSYQGTRTTGARPVLVAA
jgi:hypothetical protein